MPAQAIAQPIDAYMSSTLKVTSMREKKPPDVKSLLLRLKRELRKRGGEGLIAINRKFKIMDDDGSGTLSLAEFKKAMGEMNLPDTGLELKALFEHFDADGSGLVTHEEFLQGVRDPLTPRRLALVRQAFGAIDRDGSGVVEPGEIADRYDASRHPDVLAGTKTADEVYAQFLATFDVGGEVDGKVTAREFENYYTNVGASIDADDYFELMIRNAWHISGGEGWCANTANRRVLVTAADGTQSVQEIKDDLGLKADDKAGMMARLKAQGVNAANISTFDGAGDNDKPPPPPPPNRAHRGSRTSRTFQSSWSLSEGGV